MKKIVKKVGNSIGITFSPEELKINKIKIGSILDLSDIVVEKVMKK